MGEIIINRDVTYTLTPPFPRNMLMELTNICNHNCIFCGYGKMQRAKKMCDRKLAERILTEAYEHGTREVGFYVIGEPLLYQHLSEIISYAKQTGYEYIYLTTNGALADRTKLEEIISAGLDSIKFSINAATKETYLKIHGKNDFDTVKENLESLQRLRTEKGLPVQSYISFIRNEWNKAEEPLLFQEFEPLVDKIYVYDCVNQGGNMHELVSLGVVDEKNKRPGSKRPCDMVFNRLHITAEGYLDACCADTEGYLAAVDLRECSLKEAWESQIMQTLRERHLYDNLKGTVCYDCIYNQESESRPINEKLCALHK